MDFVLLRFLIVSFSSSSPSALLSDAMISVPLSHLLNPSHFVSKAYCFMEVHTAVIQCHSHDYSRTEASLCRYTEFGIIRHHTFTLQAEGYDKHKDWNNFVCLFV